MFWEWEWKWKEKEKEKEEKEEKEKEKEDREFLIPIFILLPFLFPFSPFPLFPFPSRNWCGKCRTLPSSCRKSHSRTSTASDSLTSYERRSKFTHFLFHFYTPSLIFLSFFSFIFLLCFTVIFF
jgi:hypothetical protein